MNGEVKTYKLNEPMTWKEFKGMPDEFKTQYIKLIRNKWGTPDKNIAEMLGVHPGNFCRLINKLGIGLGSSGGNSKRKWDRDGFEKWRFDIVEKTEEDENVDTMEAVEIWEDFKAPSEPDRAVSRVDCEKTHSIPTSGYLDFDCPADEALGVINTILGTNRVKLSVTWEVCD